MLTLRLEFVFWLVALRALWRELCNYLSLDSRVCWEYSNRTQLESIKLLS